MRSIRLALFAVFSFLLIFQLIVCVAGLKSGPRDRADFRQLYVAGYMARTGQGPDLYNYGLEERLQNSLVSPAPPLPFDHLAYEALLFAPFSLLNYSTSYFAFAAFNLLLLIVTQRLFRRYLAPLEVLGKFVPEAIFFCFLPMAIAIVLGQDSILLLLLAVLAFLALDKGCDARAGLLISLGLFKFQYVLPIVLLFLLWRKWRFVFGAAAGGFVVLSISLWITRLSGMRSFVRTMLDMSVGLYGHAQQLKFGTYPSAMPNLRGFIDTVAGTHLSPSAMQWAVGISMLLVILLASRLPPSLPVAILAAVLVSYHGLIHDSSLLALPLGIVLVQAVSRSDLFLGSADVLVFVSPAVLLVLLDGRFFPMAIVLLALLFLQRSATRATAPVTTPGPGFP
jgi:hypothetical protein